MRSQFTAIHRQRYGFAMENKRLIADTASVEVIGHTDRPVDPDITKTRTTPLVPKTTVPMYTANAWHPTPVYHRDDLVPGDIIPGPAMLIEPTGTNIVEPGWWAELTIKGHLILQAKGIQKAEGKRQKAEGRRLSLAPTNDQQPITNNAGPTPLLSATPPLSTPSSSVRAGLKPALTNPPSPDPVLLEIFNNLFRAVADEMGLTLQNTSYSVNIKERLDFSCAIFDQQGQLVANAPHIPVHLGSMGESVQSLILARGNQLKPGDVYVQNNPYNGGTHLPDVTVITPVFLENAPPLPFPGDSSPKSERQSHPTSPTPSHPIFYVASRGHHADIGGITPGSMPPNSTSIEEEGVLLDNVQLVDQGRFLEAELLERLHAGPYPVRNATQNVADLQAQIAANAKGVQELRRLVEHYGLECGADLHATCAGQRRRMCHGGSSTCCTMASSPMPWTAAARLPCRSRSTAIQPLR
jgi:5-oxoprolinase (ATP-hydrolysing)